MRFYDLILSDPNSGQVWQPTQNGNGFALQNGGSTFTSFKNGKTLRGALDIELDFVAYPFDTPQGNSLITIWGVGLGMIGQAAQLAGAEIILSAGMKPGLPLATAVANQAGIIMDGTVFQGFGNWQGTEQTLHLVCNPGAASQNKQNISWNWAAGTRMQDALGGTLAQAFRDYTAEINISENLILSNDEAGQYTTLSNFASAVKKISLKIGYPLFGPNYAGVRITITGNTISAFDGTNAPEPVAIQFIDLIGQPTWIDTATVNFKTVLRSDIAVGDQITFPKGIQTPYALTIPSAAVPNTPASSKSAFQGTFTVSEVHHFGRFRQANADSWASTFSAVTSLGTPAT